MALDEPKENEEPETIDGLQVLIDAQVRTFAAEQVLDYLKTPRGEGFAIKPVGGGSCC